MTESEQITPIEGRLDAAEAAAVAIAVASVIGRRGSIAAPAQAVSGWPAEEIVRAGMPEGRLDTRWGGRTAFARS